MTDRKSVLRIGVARKRLSTLRMRMSTVTKPTPHSPPPIRLMPTRPGTRKSMYRPPGSYISVGVYGQRIRTAGRSLESVVHLAPSQRLSCASDRNDIRKPPPAAGTTITPSCPSAAAAGSLASPPGPCSAVLFQGLATNPAPRPAELAVSSASWRTSTTMLSTGLLRKAMPRATTMSDGEAVHPEHGFRLAVKLAQSGQDQLAQRPVAFAETAGSFTVHGVASPSRRCRPVSVTKTSSRLAWRVFRLARS